MSLLLTREKVFDRILFNMFRFFLENNLVTQKQSGLRPGDFYINQLLSINCGIYKSFDDEFEVRSLLFRYI